MSDIDIKGRFLLQLPLFISKLATIPTSFGCSGFFCEFASGKSADEHRSVPVVGAEAAVVGVVVADEPEIK